MLLFSQSAASVFCCLLVVAIMPLWRWARVKEKQQLPVYTAATILLLAGMYAMTTHSWMVFNLLGRNPTLTGRTQLWASVWDAIMKRPILGYGYDAFWASMKAEALDVRIGAGWLAQRSDNGFLDLALSLGAIGMLLFVYVCAVYFRKSIDYLRSEPLTIGLWPITYLCIFLVQNMSESTLLTRGTFPLLVFIMINTSLALNRCSEVMADRMVAKHDSDYELEPAHSETWA
jgi:O-antigen ligase